jgi:phage repressor protein C with HTH and peptisase S24 domain
MDDLTSRFLYYLEHLKSTGQTDNQQAFAATLGLSSSAITEIKSGRTTTISNILDRMTKHFDTVNGNWLLYGTGPMLKEYPSEPAVITVNEEDKRNVIYVNTKARAGYLSGFADPEYVAGLPLAHLPQLPREKDFRMFEVSGDSMWPTLKDKDAVICQYLSRSNVKDNQLCVVICSEGVLVKRIFNRIQEDKQLILKSDNQEVSGEYPDIAVPADDVKEIWQVVKCISDIQPDANNAAALIAELKATVNRLEKLLVPGKP